MARITYVPLNGNATASTSESSRVGQVRRFRIRISVLMASLVMVAGSALLASADNAQAKTLTPLQKGLAFYNGQTITLTSPSAAGQGYDLVARTIAPYLSSYLHATVNIVDNGTAGGVAAEDSIAAYPATGLQIGIMNENAIVAANINGSGEVNFNPEREAYIGSSTGTISMLITATSSPYTSIAALVDSATPVKTLVEAGTGSTGTMHAFFGILGVHTQWITGYSTQGALAAGFVGGDGPVSYGSDTLWLPLVAGGVARVLAVTSKPPVGMTGRRYLEGIPTLSHILATDKTVQKSKTLAAEASVLTTYLTTGGSATLYAQSKVASYKLVALRAADQYAYSQAIVKSESIVDQNSPTWISPTKAKQLYITLVNSAHRIACYIAQTC